MRQVNNCLFLLLSFTSISLAKTFTKCELVKELRRHGFPEYLMKDLVCLVKAESLFQTNIKSGSMRNGSFNWGLFKINDRYWCSTGDLPGKRCNVRCQDLVSDDMTPSAWCAQTIITTHGLGAWLGWLTHCKGKTLPELDCTPVKANKVFFDLV